jgi:hypothetical protein
MVSRREALKKAGWLAGLAATSPANALRLCPAPDLPPDFCSAMLDPYRFARTATPSLQRNSQWCWAACIEMVCRWHGVQLSQESIVNRIYGGMANMPANDQQLTSALNDVWEADDGSRIRISASVFSAAMNLAGVSNERVIADLSAGRPLINGSRTHATVVARVDYLPRQRPDIRRVHVIDPWPGAASPPQYARFLEADEMTAVQHGGSLRYLASVSLHEL